jgi:Ca2+-binding EF-hand superfamily protein
MEGEGEQKEVAIEDVFEKIDTDHDSKVTAQDLALHLPEYFESFKDQLTESFCADLIKQYAEPGADVLDFKGFGDLIGHLQGDEANQNDAEEEVNLPYPPNVE